MSIPTHFERQDAPGAGSFDPDKLEIAPGRQREGIEGWIPELATETELREALEKAFDYRGDVTLTQKKRHKNRGLHFRSRHWFHAKCFVCKDFAKQWRREIENRLFRHRSAGFQRSRPGCRQELGRLGEKVLGKEGIWCGSSQPTSGLGRVNQHHTSARNSN